MKFFSLATAAAGLAVICQAVDTDSPRMLITDETLSRRQHAVLFYMTNLEADYLQCLPWYHEMNLRLSMHGMPCWKLEMQN